MNEFELTICLITLLIISLQLISQNRKLKKNKIVNQQLCY
jgi:hypothetical protein